MGPGPDAPPADEPAEQARHAPGPAPGPGAGVSEGQAGAGLRAEAHRPDPRDVAPDRSEAEPAAAGAALAGDHAGAADPDAALEPQPEPSPRPLRGPVPRELGRRAGRVRCDPPARDGDDGGVAHAGPFRRLAAAAASVDREAHRAGAPAA